MKFNVVKRATYTLDNKEVVKFKEAMLEYYEEENLEEEEDCPYTIADIPDKIVEDVLADAIQDSFENDDCYYDGIDFEPYFNTIYLNCYEEGVRDCIYEAVGNWITEMEGK